MLHILAVCIGVLLHLTYFNRGEHHLHVVSYLKGFLLLYSLIVGSSTFYLGQPLSQACAESTQYCLSVLTGLYASLLGYRGVFHPLNNFPGPWGARISDFWLSLRLAKHDAFRQILKLHEQYGDFVRIGSNTLSIVHPEAVETFYGLGSKCTKAAWYDLTYPIVSLQTTRDRAAHDKRRRTWSTAFSDKALRGYEERLKEHQAELITHIDSQGQNAVNMSKTFNLFSFDVMGDLAFSNSFGMLASSEEHWAIKLFKEGLQPLGYLFPVWFFRMMVAIPRLADDWWKFIDFCAQKADDRIKASPSFPNTCILLTCHFIF